MSDLMQQTRGTTAEWAAAVVPLEAGQFGYDTDLDVVKIGNGTDLWAALPAIGAGGGGGGGMTIDDLMPWYLKDVNMHATYSDDFVGGPDLAKWTRRTVTSGDETNDVWNAEAGVGWATVSAGWEYLMPAPAGDFYWHAAVAVESASATSQVGAGIIDSTGAGRAAVLRNGAGIANVSMAAYVYSGYNTDYAETAVRHRLEIWAVSIRKSGTSYSVAGRRCLPDVAGFNRLPVFATANTWTGTVDRLMVGCTFTDAPFSRAMILRANLTT